MVTRSMQQKGEPNTPKPQRPVARGKRHSITMDSAAKKRRKVDQSPSSTTRSSPMVHGTLAVSKHTPSVVRQTFSVFGLPLMFGVGDTGQLGLGPDITERSRPARFSLTSIDSLGFDEATLETGFIQVCAGGMHTVCLEANGRVVTCGCNDEGALGRLVSAPTELVDTGTLANQSSASTNGNASEEASQLDTLQHTTTIVDETHPAYVPLPMRLKITMVSAGDSHTAALDSDGQVWIWGTFRGPSGPIGLTKAGEIAFTPQHLLNGSNPTDSSCTAVDTGGHSTQPSTNTALLQPSACVVKIASGQDHLVCLTEEGRLYTMGCGEQGQLGRIAERFARTGGRSGINLLLQPTECRVRGAVRFSDVWAGGFATIAVCQNTGDIFTCGLNNYGQLALLNPVPSGNVARRHNLSGFGVNGSTPTSDTDETAHNITTISEDGDVEMQEAAQSVDAALLISDRREADKSEAVMLARQGPLIQFMLVKACGFNPDRGWRQFAISMHHTLALDKDGHVYAVGRSDYGRLGVGSTGAPSPDVAVTTVSRVKGILADRVCTSIACGESCSFAIDTEGLAYSWGMGSNRQLGHGDADDDCHEPGVVQGKQLKERHVAMVDAGGQHTVLLAYKNSLTSNMVVEEKTNTSIQVEVNRESIIFDPRVAQSAKTTASSVGDHLGDNNGIGVGDTFSKLTDRDAYMVPGLCGGEPLLVPPIGGAAPQARRPVSCRRHSPCGSVSGAAGFILSAVGLGADSTTGSTACATINSSSAVSDTSSVGSCASSQSGMNTGAGLLSASSSLGSSSQWNSARSTDGGGSSRCSSAFDLSSAQSSSAAALLVPVQQQTSVLSPLAQPADQCDEDLPVVTPVVVPDVQLPESGSPGDDQQLPVLSADDINATHVSTNAITNSESGDVHMLNT